MERFWRMCRERDSQEQMTLQAPQASSLSPITQRKLFVTCFASGIVCSILGAAIFLLSNEDLKFSALFYTLGNIGALASTYFLMGPMKQLKNMFNPARLIATIVMLVSFILTLCAVFWWDKKELSEIFCVLQFLSISFYTLSNIPYISKEMLCNLPRFGRQFKFSKFTPVVSALEALTSFFNKGN